ncbi:hypothetical protein GIB67_040494 [Kingdonia uniflora]|uniref:E3 ubiquitin-protein ligase n=1 Tax=Kingdonia uniflora TaxID=39325 RepID=A0A7J7L590_9MAGN|nr:hypothetical protein GIB67_040494 [Kingdonia uniflora]
MNIDSPSIPPISLSPQDRILQRLSEVGVPEKDLTYLQLGLIEYLKDNKSKLREVVYAILPNDDITAEVEYKSEDGDTSRGGSIRDHFRVSVNWLQWLMFEDEPDFSLNKIGKEGIGQRGVCGDVWGHNDIAYRCRTCENDSTCAICVSCFQNGNHKDHDYSLMYTGGGCCDCGDVTAWKREGFCSNHKGAEQIQPLPEEVGNRVGPVLDVLLSCWKDKLVSVQRTFEGNREKLDIFDSFGECKKVANELTLSVVETLLKFCKYSESLLSFVSRRVFSTLGLLDVLVRAERFLSKSIVKKLHELLLKLLAEPTFKYEFAKIFLNYYPDTIKETIKEPNDTALEKYPLIPTFSVQILTVPTLTPLLVKEMNLLGILLGCLRDIFIFCEGEEGHIQISKWMNLYDTTVRLVGDARYVMSHVEVPKYVMNEQKEFSRTWIQLLAYVQSMDPQKRVTGLHVEEENDNMQMPFVLGHCLANVSSLFVSGAFSNTGDEVILDSEGHLSIPSSVIWLTCECLRAIEKWLGYNVISSDSQNYLSRDKCGSSSTNFLGIRKGKNISKVYKAPLTKSRRGASSKLQIKLDSSSTYSGSVAENNNLMGASDMDYEQSSTTGRNDDTIDGVLSLSEWPNIIYDVSSQNVSAHIPLHRLLSMLLQRSLKICYGESGGKEMTKSTVLYSRSGNYHDFFGQVLRGCHPLGFSAFLMEHPLRMRVFCAQVRAGMWRKNGDAALSSCEWYRSVRWSEQGLEFDLFLLQCCAALAPPDLYVKRILDRFRLSYYLSLNLERSNEYEPLLVQEMLTLIIQIIKERRFCGLSQAECLQRELIYKLAIGDATHSQLVKSLPHEISKNNELRKILDAVAVYATPSGLKQGKYSLRETCWKELDLYHPRWNSRDLQVAEERYLWFCKVSALNAQLPRWTKVFQPLNGISQIATSKAVLKILRAVLFYAVFADKSRTPDGVLFAALHLLSLALDICCLGSRSSDEYSPPPLLEFAGEAIAINGSDRMKPQSLLSLLVSLMRMHMKEKVTNFVEAGHCDVSSLIENLLKRFAKLSVDCMIELHKLAPELVCHLSHSQSTLESESHNPGSTSNADERKAKARERQAAILAKMKVAQSKFMATLKSTSTDEVDVSKSKQEVFMSENDHIVEEQAPFLCSLCRDPDSRCPVSFLILLQKSRLLSFVERGPPSWEHGCLDKKHPSLTSEKFERNVQSCSSEMKSSQIEKLVCNAINEFIHDGHHIEVDAFLEFVKARLPAARNIQLPSIFHDTNMSTGSSIEMMENNIYQSILSEMQDNQEGSNSHPEEILIQTKSAVSTLLGLYIASLSQETSGSTPESRNSRGEITSLRSSNLSLSFDGVGPKDCDGIFMSSCGHALHRACRDRYLSSLRERYASRIVFEGGHAVDPDQGEFLCPICRRLANSVLPAFPSDSSKFGKQMLLSDSSPEPTRLGIHFRLAQALSLLQSAANRAGSSGIQKAFAVHRNERMQPSLEPVFNLLCRMYFSERRDLFRESGRVSHSMIFWDTLKYSLISTEIAARSESTSLEALYGELESSSGFILSLLLKVFQSTQSDNGLQVLLRFRGIQLFAGSICSGVSMDDFSTGIGSQRGSISSVLNHIDKGVEYPDIQFWKRAADPVLAHDPFLSLMWILFSFPGPSLSDADFFFSLVHLFYAVCVLQMENIVQNDDEKLLSSAIALLDYFKCRLSWKLYDVLSIYDRVTIFYLSKEEEDVALFTCRGKYQFDISELGFPDCPEIFSVVHQQYFISNYIDSICPPKDIIRRLTHPFLRRCALLWKLLTSSVTAPFSNNSYKRDRSSHVNNEMQQRVTDHSVELREVEELENMFQIPDLDIILKDKLLHGLSSKWSNHICAEFKVRNFKSHLHSTPAVPFRLMGLPHLYQDLLERSDLLTALFLGLILQQQNDYQNTRLIRYIKQQCPQCKSTLNDPALCLLCGRICSPSWKSCCRESGCQTHAMSCGAGIGVFLLIRRTTILLQRSARQTFWPSPYLDVFGEEDVEIQRGKPLYLNGERYAALTNMVASYGFDQSSEVLRQTTIESLFMI